jgi:hypothetical protein
VLVLVVFAGGVFGSAIIGVWINDVFKIAGETIMY